MGVTALDPFPASGPTLGRVADQSPTVADLEVHRRELTGYCYRLLGSGSEAEDAVQETMLRAWQATDRYRGAASVRTWLYRIATNVCIDMGRSVQRRARPVDLGPARSPDPAHLCDVLPDRSWITPIPDRAVIDLDGDPADVAVARETIGLAFVNALQQLPAKQRAALVLCDVLRWPAAEVAELLDTSAAAVNSALQRARGALAERSTVARLSGLSDTQRGLLARYVDAFERYDLDALAELLHDDVVQTMPPYAMWLRGADALIAWYGGGGLGCKGSRLLAGHANGCPAFAQYRIDPSGGHSPWALQVLELRGDRIGAIHAFLDTEAFDRFGFPPRLDG